MKLTIFLILSLLGSSLFGQNFMSFKVINGINKKPIKGGLIKFLKDGDVRYESGETDKTGRYKIKFFPKPGEQFQVVIYKDGYKRVRKDVNLLSSGVTTIAIYPDEDQTKKQGLVYEGTFIRSFD
ncbi:MAG TPA: hypothetical protein VNS32_15530, partial [Flavisolibacter sp.]|nr:hypothetical protein [Flavisolibacter sp.]